MSYEENYARKRSQSYFRTSMDIGMGIFYTVIGFLIVYARSFGNLTIPPVVAYILGSMMIIGGLFRLYRGLKVILPGKKEQDQ